MTLQRRQGLTRTPMPPPRQPMTRTKPLRPAVPDRTGGDKSATRTRSRGRAVGAATGAPKKPGEFTPKVKRLVRTRAGRGDAAQALCEGCGYWLGAKYGEFHHRAGRGSGGCRDEVVNGPSNCLLLCGVAVLGTGCHGAATRFEAHLGMDAAGLWIGRGTTPAYDPRNVSVMLHGQGSGLLVYLAEDGLGPDGTGYLFEAPGEVAAA